MISDTLLKRIPDRAEVKCDAGLHDYTTFRLGGRCPAIVQCPDADTLADTVKLLHSEGIPHLVIGQGSNLLVSDEGLDSVVLRYCAEEHPEVRTSPGRVHVTGNSLLDDLVCLTIAAGVGDLTFCSGIPGTVGGAIAGNAGAFGRQIGDMLESVELLDGEGNRSRVHADELGFAYRTSRLKQTREVVLSAVLNLKVEDKATMQAERERILELRRTKHPDWKTMPCAGSVFRNIEPTSAAERRQAAGWFLEEAGAKDFKVGAAHLFEKHANIIIAEPGSTATDVARLMRKMVDAVREKFGFDLQSEVRLLGRFPGGC